jgi:hypothetical protein
MERKQRQAIHKTRAKGTRTNQGTGQKSYLSRTHTSHYQGKGLWTSFHRWLQSVTGLPREYQRFTQRNDGDSDTIRRCTHPGSRDDRILAGKRFEIEEKSFKKELRIHWRTRKEGPNVVPLEGGTQNNTTIYRMAFTW